MSKSPTESFLQIAAVILLVVLCLWVVAPFVTLIIWGVIIAVAVYPAFRTLATALGGREKLAASLIIMAGFVILVVPVWIMADSSVAATRTVAESMQGGAITIPPPADRVAEWPLVGERIHALWTGAAEDLQSLVNQFQPQLMALGERIVRGVGGVVLGVIQFAVSIFIAGVLLLSAEAGYRASNTLANALAGERGQPLVDMSIETVRSVSKGVVGVAIIQAFLAGVGLAVIGVPAAGIWASLVLLLAIIQLPPLLILGPIAVWVFSVEDAGAATLFAVYAVLVSVSDSFLKPIMFGRGTDVPMLVILVGAIGGVISAGLLGLFLGPVVLAVGHRILLEWMTLHESESGLPGDTT